MMKTGLRLLALTLACILCLGTPALASPGGESTFTSKPIVALADVQTDYIKRIADSRVTRLWGESIVRGAIPQANGFASVALEKAYNDRVGEAYNELLAKMGETAHSVEFSYVVTGDDNYVSTRITAKSVTTFSQESCVCIVFSPKTEKLLNLNDVLGPNGVKLANRVLADAVKAAPEAFNPTVADIIITQDFYMEANVLVMVFDQFEIAPGAEGMVYLPVALDGLTNFTVDKNEYYPSAATQYSVKMVPIRNVSEAFGYQVTWNGSVVTVDLLRDGTLVTSVKIGENSFFRPRGAKRKLETAPELVNGRTHVPISFFDEILGLLYYVDSNGNIVFSNYTAPAAETP